MCVNVFCCRPREEWPFQNRLVEMFGAQDVSVRTLVRPYATLPSISARRTSADNAAATDGQL
jgi:S-adenosylmethionine decarboxylase